MPMIRFTLVGGLQRRRRQRQAGQTIIEILVATGVIAMVMTAVASGLTLSVQNTSQAKYRALASKQVQEGLEMFLRERSRLGWESFRSSLASGSYCLGEVLPADSAGFQALPRGECGQDGYALAGTTYFREANVTIVSADEVEITVTVRWQDGEDLRTTSSTQILRNWQ